MNVLNVLLFLLFISTFILIGYLASEITGKVTFERISANLTRAIDGDTIVIDSGEHVRLLGINTPEKSQPYYQEAKDLLESFEGKQIELESRGQDKYKRTLGYIFYNNYLLNKLVLENGLASLYVYDKDEYYSQLDNAEESARNSGIGLWARSPNYGCIDLVKLVYIEPGERCTNGEQLVLNNRCSSMQVIIKDDANHIEEITLNSGIFEKNYSCVWNDAGDSLYVRDSQGLLLFYRY